MNRTFRTMVLWTSGAVLGVLGLGVAGTTLAHAEVAKKVTPRAAASGVASGAPISPGASGVASGAPTSPGAGGVKPQVQPPRAGERKAPIPKSGSEKPGSENSSTRSTDSEQSGNQSSACPAGMVLVEGDYCSKVEHECEKSWYDESNKKTVCERFAKKAHCIGGTTKKRFCIDKYEWPNKKGERPEVMNKFHQAEVKCAAIGKRLCTESEWTMACEGPKLLPFPYGFDRDTEICHGDVLWDSPDMHKVAARDPDELARLWKGVRSGSQPGCVSDYGVYDMPGNTDEVVASETYSSDFRGKFDSVHTGGPWYKGVRNQCRPKIYTHDEGFYYYFLSFRCCAEPDGKPTDPLTPKQKKMKWGMERVERIAGFTRKDVDAALAKKAKLGHCSCKPKDVRCNTICGTLLGASAKDYPKGQKSKALMQGAEEKARAAQSQEKSSAHSDEKSRTTRADEKPSAAHSHSDEKSRTTRAEEKSSAHSDEKSRTTRSDEKARGTQRR